MEDETHLEYKIRKLEKRIEQLEKIDELNIDCVPIKYKKTFPNEDESVFFKT